MHQVTQHLGLARGIAFSGDIGKVRAAFQGDFLPLKPRPRYSDPLAGQGGVREVLARIIHEELSGV